MYQSRDFKNEMRGYSSSQRTPTDIEEDEEIAKSIQIGIKTNEPADTED